MINFNKNLIPLSIIVAGVVIAGAVIFFNNPSEKQIGEKVVNYINDNLVQENITASLMEIKKEDGVYKLKLKVGDVEYDSYATLDGKFLFPEGYDLEQEISKEAAAEQPQYSLEILEKLAKCLLERGAKFYGTSECGWCQRQKEIFKEAIKYLPYVECLDEETGQMSDRCKEAGITAFPTWEFSNGEKISEFKTIEKLAELSGCSL